MNREASNALSKGLKTTILILSAMVIVGLIALPGLRQAIQRLQSPPKTEEQSRREVMEEPISTRLRRIRWSQRRYSFHFRLTRWSAPSNC
jgi:hypothetical protein